jgi:hypothetical protein
MRPRIMIPFYQLGPRLNRLSRLFACLLTILPLRVTQAADIEWRNPTQDELEQLFDLATRQLPERMLLDSEIDIQEPALPSDQLEEIIKEDIERALGHERKVFKAIGKSLPENEVEELNQEIRTYLSDRFSGKRHLLRREWYARSGKIYRIDRLDFASLVAEPVIGSEGRSERIDTGSSEITFNDPDFLRDEKYSNALGFAINHGIKSASVFVESEFQFDPPELWHAYSIEPELAFPITSLLMHADSAKKKSSFNDSMAGIKRNEKHLQNATDGELLGWNFRAHDEDMDGIPTTRIRISGPPSSVFTKILMKMAERNAPREIKHQLEDASSAVYTFWITKDPAPPRLLRAEKAVRGGSRLVSIRQSFNHHEFPEVWTTETYDSENQLLEKKQITFKKADLKPDFIEVFGPGLLEDLEFVDVDGLLVQNKHNGTLLILDESDSKNGLSQWTIRAIFFLFLLFPVYFLRKRFQVGSQ